jgi:hypothetical protein
VSGFTRRFGAFFLLALSMLGGCSCNEATKRKRGLESEPEPEPEPASRRLDVIYVVTIESQLFAFDPTVPGLAAYQLVGTLACDSKGSPQSMAVDREGMAWVFFSSGKLYRVSTRDASCTPTDYVHPSSNTMLGMAFTAESRRSEQERLFIASPAFGLANVDTNSLRVEHLDRTPFKAELAGGSDAKLFMLTPREYGAGTAAARLDQIDRATHRPSALMRLADYGVPSAWAFARYDGLFYLFITPVGLAHSQTWMVDAANKSERLRDPELDFVVVGAGQSTKIPQPDTGAALSGSPFEPPPKADLPKPAPLRQRTTR